jgi:membrane protein DedA with SNARE-associated domain
MTAASVLVWLLKYRYLVLFPAVVIEGPVVTILAGFLVSLGKLNFWICLPLVVSADVLSDLFMYVQGRWGGKLIIEKWGHLFGVKPGMIVRLEEHFKNHAGRTLIIGKISHLFGGPVLLAAGMARVKVGKFFWYNVFGTIPKSLVLLLIGLYFGAAYAKFDNFFTIAGWSVVVLVVIGIIVYFIFSKISKKYLEDTTTV